MKYLKLFLAVTIIVCLSVTAAFAVAEQPAGKAGQTEGKTAQPDDKTVQPIEKNNKVEQKGSSDFEKDPVKALEGRKEKVQSLLKEGKITKEEAAEITARIDAKIAEMKEFDKLTVPQKKARLMENFKTIIGKKVKEGRLTQEKADEMLKDFSKKVEQWDGNGYPKFHRKWFRKDKHHLKDRLINP